MTLEAKDVIALIALLVSLATLLSTLIARRDRVKTQTLTDLETRLKEKLAADTQRLETRVQESMTKSAENNAEIHKLRNELNLALREVITKDEMQAMLELVLEPVKLHMRRTEAFIDESLRLGLQRRDLDRNLRGPHNG